MDTVVIGHEGALEDVGFHLGGNQFDGPINWLNVVPGSGRSVTLSNGEVLKNLDQSRYKVDFEHPLADLIRETGAPMNISIQAVYSSSNSTRRPDLFVAGYQKSDGDWIFTRFINRAGG
ncbi:hypothetical protein ACO0LL_21385 [Undibacterium sp. TC4M20W]|uniref:hypothetical protein n=1 Tax=unclassified Undibacterium TaxID=2630295 RepID=UPI003BEFE709